MPDVTGEKILVTNAATGDRNPGRPRDRPTLYRVAITAGLYRKAVQVYHIAITTTNRRAIKHGSKAVNLEWVNHLAQSLSHNVAIDIGEGTESFSQSSKYLDHCEEY